jgi:hypothetical protein
MIQSVRSPKFGQEFFDSAGQVNHEKKMDEDRRHEDVRVQTIIPDISGFLLNLNQVGSRESKHRSYAILSIEEDI